MDKLFNYSKIVSYIAFLTALLWGTTAFPEKLPFAYTIFLVFVITLYLSITFWFGIIAIKSAKGSSLKLPSIWGIAFSVAIIITTILPQFSPYMFRNHIMDTTSLLYTLRAISYLSVICGVGLGIIFIRLSKFFNRKKINTICVVLGVLLIINNIIYASTLLLSALEITLKFNVVGIINVITYVVFAVFFLLFSKYNK